MFASLNSSHRVTLRLGFVTLLGVPLTVVVFGAVIMGMVVMLGAGVQSDLKVRRILRARLVEEDREERERAVDQSQQDLFPESDGAMIDTGAD
jgi:heme exporter protein D